MNVEDIAAVARILDLITKNPPRSEEQTSRMYPGTPTLEQRLRSWLKERL